MQITGAHMKVKLLVVLLASLFPPLSSFLPAQPPAATERATPQAAVEALQRALEANDFATLAQIVPGPENDWLKTLAGPMAKAQAAQAKLETVLKEQPTLPFTSPFATALRPFAGLVVELVEVGKEGGINTARVRFGRKGQPLKEEVLGLVSEGSSWRISLPAELRKELQRLGQSSEELKKQAERLDGVAKVLDQLATEIDQKKLKTKEAALLRLAQLVQGAKLGDEPPTKTSVGGEPKKP